MPTSNLLGGITEINDGLESIVIVNALGDIPGGLTLDVSAAKAAGEKVIKSGRIIIKDANGVAKPLGITGGNYADIQATEKALGVLKATVHVDDPRAAVLTIGQVNAAAMLVKPTEAIVKALPRIEFLNL